MYRPKLGSKFAARILSVSVIAMMWFIAPGAWTGALAGKFKVLHSFCNSGSCGDGSQPQAGLVMDESGNFYGTTVTGGHVDNGAVFELQRSENGNVNFKKLYKFCAAVCEGSRPAGSLIVDTAGNLYGLTSNGGTGHRGEVFELSLVVGKNHTKWVETDLYSFCQQLNCPDGDGPRGSLTYAGASNGVPYDGVSPLFGVTGGGGTANAGVVFELTNNGGQWTEKVLYDFCSQGGDSCTDGKYGSGGLVMDQAGNLFGATVAGGGDDFEMMGAGIVFELSLVAGTWTQTVLHHFCAETSCADGARPVGNLAMDSNGDVFGVTTDGGGCRLYKKSGCGVVYKLVLDGANSEESVLHVFCQKHDCIDGTSPVAGVFLDTLGNLYGTTYQGGGNDIDYYGVGGGILFKLEGNSMSVIHRFCSNPNCADGEYPAGLLIQDPSGQLFGTTQLGGYSGQVTEGGTVFQATP